MMMTQQWRALLLRRSALELESLYPSHLLLAQLQSQAFRFRIFLETKSYPCIRYAAETHGSLLMRELKGRQTLHNLKPRMVYWRRQPWTWAGLTGHLWSGWPTWNQTSIKRCSLWHAASQLSARLAKSFRAIPLDLNLRSIMELL